MKIKRIDPSQATQKVAGTWRLIAAILLLVAVIAASNDDIIFRDSFENHAPVITSDPVTVALIDVLYSYDAVATDSDGDVLMYGLVVSPDNMTIGELSGEIRWTPDQLGVFAVELLVSDGNGGTALQQWDINVQAVLDSDNDGLSDDEERAIGTDPNDPDSDDDGLKDGEEVNQYDTDPLDADTDNDGLNDGDEIKVYLTNPRNQDTDNDTYRDGEEIDYGSDPLDETDFPVNTVPADPADVAPEIDPTIATTVYGSTEFLYRGLNRVQIGVENDVIEPEQVAVIRGTVKSRDGAPLSGVLVTVLYHPEFGETISLADGRYDMAVNGGGYLTVTYTRDGYLPAQRQVEVAWQSWVQAPDVVLIPLDPVQTTIDLSQPGMQVARGSVVTDDRGSRQNTMLFPEGTQAEMVLPDGSTQPIGTITVSATEYSVGENGDDAMPAQLPPGIGYTYCAELTVAEAEDSGALDVQFSQPVPNYLENFIGFPAGTEVPAYYYDQDRGLWVPSPPGRVIDVVGINGGLADLDTDGDGLADDAPTLAALGITGTERQQLASLYLTGDSLWRVQLEHFSTIDYNMPYNYPESYYPETPKVNADQSLDVTCNTTVASTIACQNQTLGESIPISGTPFSLNYQSGRTPGRTASRQLSIPVRAQSCTETWVTVNVGGRRFFESMPCSTEDRVYDFTWDGLDAYGRETTALPVRVWISYVYPAYRCGYRWNELSQEWDEICVATPPHMDSLGSGTWDSVLVNADARRQGFGGWTLNANHRYDTPVKQLNLGDGSTRTARTHGQVINLQSAPFGTNIQGFAVGPGGTLFLADGTRHQIWKWSRGTLEVFAGNWRLPEGYNGDDIPATEASLFYPSDVAIGSDGSVYIADFANYRIRKVDPDGIIHTFAGNGVYANTGDGGLAVDASIGRVTIIRLGSDGSLYLVTDLNSARTNHVRRISPDGIINTVYDPGSFVSGSSTFDLRVRGLAVGADNSLYVTLYECIGQCYGEGNHTVQRIWPDGTAEVVAGTGTLPNGFSGDGGPAVDAQLSLPTALALGSDGSVYITDSWNYRIRKVTPDGMIRTVAGCGEPSGTCDTNSSRYGLLAASTRLSSLKDLELGPNGLNILSGSWSLLMESALPSIAEGELSIPDQSGNRIFFFDYEGRHLRTVNSLTGAIIHQFGYDGDGLLARIQDGDALVTTFERDSAGKPTAIIGPYGQRTELSLDANGYLATITNPAREAWQFEYTDGGLLNSSTDPNEYTSTYTYDNQGRLTQALNSAGGSQTLARTDLEYGYEVSKTTALGRATSYKVERLPTGQKRLANTSRGGSAVIGTTDNDGSTEVVFPDGSIRSSTLTSASRFGMQSPVIQSIVHETPGGLVWEMSKERQVNLSTENDPLSLVSLSDTASINGRTYNWFYSTNEKKHTLTTPEGRSVATTVSAENRPLLLELDSSLAPLSYLYDNQGRLSQLQNGDSIWTYTYDASGRLTSRSNTAGSQFEHSYDSAGRTSELRLPGGSTFGYSYDNTGNILSLSMPSGSVHAFEYDHQDRLLQYTAPGGPSLTRQYSIDGNWTMSTLPGGRIVDVDYGTNGKVISITTPEAVNSFDYVPWTCPGCVGSQIEHVARTQVSSGNTQTIEFEYDGNLLTKALWTGLAVAEFTYTYDDNFFLTSIGLLSGADSLTIPATYNSDGIASTLGSFNFVREGPMGTVSEISDGTLEITYDFDDKGRLTQKDFSIGSEVIYAVGLTYNAISQITQKVETVSGSSETRTYTYDADGQLLRTNIAAVVNEQYSYDPNGNRITSLAGSAAYDSQDRLTSLAGVGYVINSDGQLVSRGSDSFTHGTRGELLEATVGTSTVQYQYDVWGRRTGRTEASGTYQFFYSDQFNQVRLTASRDPGGALTLYYYDERDSLIAFERAGNRYHVASDQLGTPRVIFDASGSVLKIMEYGSYGMKLFDSNPTLDLVIGYAGGLEDSLTDFVRFGMRDYDPSAGRWITRDPGLFSSGSYNLYNYVGNNPVSMLDPVGLARSIGFSFCLVSCVGFQISWGEDDSGSDGLTFCQESGNGMGIAATIDMESPRPRGDFSIETTSEISTPIGSLRQISGTRNNYGHNSEGIAQVEIDVLYPGMSTAVSGAMGAMSTVAGFSFFPEGDRYICDYVNPKPLDPKPIPASASVSVGGSVRGIGASSRTKTCSRIY